MHCIRTCAVFVYRYIAAKMNITSGTNQIGTIIICFDCGNYVPYSKIIACNEIVITAPSFVIEVFGGCCNISTGLDL
jgi:hypothetical protein